MHYAKPRPMDPRSPDDAEEILGERLDQALAEDDINSSTSEHADDSAEVSEPPVLGFFR